MYMYIRVCCSSCYHHHLWYSSIQTVNMYKQLSDLSCMEGRVRWSRKLLTHWVHSKDHKRGRFWIEFWVTPLISMPLDMELTFQHCWGCGLGCSEFVTIQVMISLRSCVHSTLLERAPTRSCDSRKRLDFFHGNCSAPLNNLASLCPSGYFLCSLFLLN